jgi:hypothetical protein
MRSTIAPDRRGTAESSVRERATAGITASRRLCVVTGRSRRAIVRDVKGDRVEAVVDTGQGTQTFEIEATRAGRRIEVTSSRGIVEVREVTRGGTTVRTARFMATRLVALVEHPAAAEQGRVEVETSHRLQPRRSS